MSRFSRADAEAKGWKIVHEREEFTINESGTQGRTRLQPASYRAEKIADGHTINEEAESIGLLLERISLYEAQLESKQVEQTAVPVNDNELPKFSPLTGDEAPGDVGDPAATVILAADPTDLSEPVRDTVTLTDEEWTSRSRNDAIVNADGEMVFYGSIPEASDAESLRIDTKAEVENRRAAERAVGPTKQIEIDDSQTVVDTPGGATGSVLLVRADEDNLADVTARREERSVAHEDARVNAATVAPEGAEKLAGVDVGIQERGDLSSETPRPGEVVGATPDQQPDTIPADESVADTRSAAEEAKAKELRDSEGPTEADTAEKARETSAAGEQAVQESADADAPKGRLGRRKQ